MQHRKGLFRKKVTIANMLCWTKVGAIINMGNGGFGLTNCLLKSD